MTRTSGELFGRKTSGTSVVGLVAFEETTVVVAVVEEEDELSLGNFMCSLLLYVGFGFDLVL